MRRARAGAAKGRRAEWSKRASRGECVVGVALGRRRRRASPCRRSRRRPAEACGLDPRAAGRLGRRDPAAPPPPSFSGTCPTRLGWRRRAGAASFGQPLRAPSPWRKAPLALAALRRHRLARARPGPARRRAAEGRPAPAERPGSHGEHRGRPRRRRRPGLARPRGHRRARRLAGRARAHRHRATRLRRRSWWWRRRRAIERTIRAPPRRGALRTMNSSRMDRVMPRSADASLRPGPWR